ncbi:Methionyl-tRNA formyltransferase [Ceratocystis fimbriata CBS 114723]|uniref:methionyl-tRNA formyltransferase n=1 Tax=Ceratocystis fimbriata CBS 114723 TaxID=1035309 RepID=A0A2C5VZR4_9PEZI|nr:Methionyl-tRNA formyltransferase [Ceratocystis fimbriata CBS 114723]
MNAFRVLAMSGRFSGAALPAIPRPIYTYLSSQHCHARQSRRYATKQQSDPLRILFYGSDSFSCASLEALVAEQKANSRLIEAIQVVVRPGKLYGRGLKLKREVPLQTLAEKLALPIHERDTNTGWTPPFDYNLIVAVSFGLLIPPRLIRAAKYGGLNLHPSMLPDFRGAAPLHHTLLQNRSHIGVSLQTLHETSFDRGLVLAQTPMPGLRVSENCTLDDLNHLVAPVAAEMLVSGLRSCVHVAPQQSVGWEPPIGYKLREAPRLGKQDARMDWDGWTAEEAARRSRVLGPLWTYFSSPSGKVTRVQLTDIEWTARGGPIAELKSLSKIKLLSFASDSGTGNAAIVKPVWRTENGGVILEMKMGGHLHVKKIKLAGKKEQTPAWIFTKLYVAGES